MSAADSVLALVSGLPKGIRERRVFVVLQVYVDDSSTDARSLVLAGFIGRSQNWAEFSDEWADLLTIRPPWKRFKMSEIMAASPGEETWERIIHHYRVIEKYVDGAICIVVPREPLIEAARDYKMPKKFENPYFCAWRTLIRACVDWQGGKGVTEPIDFIFDEQSEASFVLRAWNRILEGFPSELQPLVKGRPIFRSDDDFLPLQAADMYAWWVRKKYDKEKTILSGGSVFPWSKIREDFPTLILEHRRNTIRKQMRLDKDEIQMTWRISIVWRASTGWRWEGDGLPGKIPSRNLRRVQMYRAPSLPQ